MPDADNSLHRVVDSEPYQLLHSDRGSWIFVLNILEPTLYEDVPSVSSSCLGEKLLRSCRLLHLAFVQCVQTVWALTPSRTRAFSLLRSTNTSALLVPSTCRTTIGDRAFPLDDDNDDDDPVYIAPFAELQRRW